MYSISKEFVEVIYQLFDGKIGHKDFESWIYKNDALEKEIEREDYFQLISLNYNEKDANYKLFELLECILDKYLKQKQVTRDRKSIIGTCINNRCKYRDDGSESKFSLTINKEYDIITINYNKDSNGNCSYIYRIIDDESRIYLVPSGILMVKVFEIPEGWVIEEDAPGCITIEPKEWNGNFYRGTYSFWEDFYDDRKTALIAFVKVLHKFNIEVPEQYRIYARRLLYEQELRF